MLSQQGSCQIGSAPQCQADRDGAGGRPEAQSKSQCALGVEEVFRWYRVGRAAREARMAMSTGYWCCRLKWRSRGYEDRDRQAFAGLLPIVNGGARFDEG